MNTVTATDHHEQELALILSSASPKILKGLENLLLNAGFSAFFIGEDRREVEEILSSLPTPRLAILDLVAPAADGIGILNRLSRRVPHLQAVLLGQTGALRAPGVGVVEFDQTVAFGWLTGAWHLDDLAELEHRLQVMRGLGEIQPEDLANAIYKRQFELHYQPIFDIRDARPKLARVEGLLRWNHPRFGLLLPGIFWSHIEAAGLTHRATDLTLALAAGQLVEWRRTGIGIPISVNITSDQLLDLRFPARLSRLIAELNVEQKQIVLEITEAGIMSSSPEPVTVVEDLIDRGFQLVIDGFGRGPISFRQVMTQPFIGVKIDGGLIREVRRQERARQLVSGMIHLAHDLRMSVTAKNIETQEMLLFLKGLGCDEAQGWYLGGPVPPAEFVATAAGESAALNPDHALVSSPAVDG